MTTTLNMEGVNVKFPFTPYDCQRDYMSRVIQCLNKETNGILESPTGTGKTLCLLCATLAWRDHFKDTISAQKIAQKPGGAEMLKSLVSSSSGASSSWGAPAATDGDTPTSYSDLPRIIYASRTHSQLSQVINELKNTAYSPKMCVLGSRDQMCIHSEVMRQESSHVKIHMCRAKIVSRSCHFYNSVEEKSGDKDLVNSIMDVEDLVKYGIKQKSCPYYLARSLKQNAEIIFTPYNYLLDPKSRRAHNIELKGSVVIFDEAHNLEKMCEESTSFDLTPYDVASAIDAVDKLLVEQAKDETSGVTEDFNVENFNSSGGLNLSLQDIAKIKQILLDLEATIDSYEVPDKGITKPGSFIYELLERAQLNYKTKTEIFESLEKITGYLAGRSGLFSNTTGLQKLADIIQLVFAGDPQEGGKRKEMQSNKDMQSNKGDPQEEGKGKNIQSNIAMFKVHIHKDNSFQKKKQQTDIWASSSSKKQGNVLSYWCFSPGFSMAELTRQGVRSIILTSGTLSPLSSFASEMQIPFPVTLENPHVIQKDQIFVTIIDRGPDGEKLSSAFDRRFVPENMSSLGCTVANLGRVVPHGLLVFFPSYPVMDKTLEFWRANGHAGRIENMKPMFVEPRGKGTFTEVINGYYDKVNDPTSRGGSFFAVCRGKASEGLDFADTYGRGVIITGMPFPPRMDPRVLLKMQFLDEMCRKKVPGVKYLSGQEWYRQQASRAVNQAIGRVIRHKEDFGAIFLCDQRFKNHDAKAQLPSWVRPYVRQYDNFGHVVRDVAQFFKVAQKLRPFVDKKGEVKSCEQVQSAETQPSTSRSCSSSLSCQTQKAKMLDAHVPSLKRRKLNEQGMAKLCIEYETDVQSFQRRPVSLLHALEHSDQSKRDPMHSFVGEEQASRLSTLSLQYDKRVDDEQRGGKRKIKLVQERRTGFSEVSDDGKGDKAKRFLADMKRSLSQENFQRIMQALQNYKRGNDIDELLAETASLLTGDVNTHSLFRGFYQFIRPHHKKRFDEKCQELTGSGCGYKPDHSLSKEEKEELLQQGASVGQSGAAGLSSNGTELNTALQLNNGGCHLGSHASGKPGASQAQTVQPVAKKESQLLVAELKKVLGAEKCNELVRAIKNYKDTENYETMVSTVVSLLTERNENFDLLIKFGQFIRPRHKKQYNEMVDALIGGP